jgi:ubiquinone/menaquinone biosynthesis C-methylase UbiE
MNYFNPTTAAERYSNGRPDFHGHSIQVIKEYLHLDSKLERALDIACGTGLSTRALLAIATNVYGTDTSKAMLDLALKKDEITYSMALAELQPFDDNYFDLITVCSGVHWFDIDKFLAEANRLLKSESYLVLYDNFFIAEMIDHDNFSSWYENVYLKEFPAPPRNNTYTWTSENLAPKNFKLVNERKFKNTITFNKSQLILYFTTQSNVIAAVEKNLTTYEHAENWLDQELTPFFDNELSTQNINYGNWIKFIQRID